MTSGRRLPADWHDGTVPDNVFIDDGAWVETSYSFLFYRSRAPIGLHVRRGASTYTGVMFDVGPEGSVSIGEYSLLNGARIICDAEITIGDYALISWNVLLMDNYRLAFDAPTRRRELEAISRRSSRLLEGSSTPRPIRIDRNVWIGFDACVLPGVTIGEGSIVGARTVVSEDVPPFVVVAGNPARIIRHLPKETSQNECR